jgi:hypothetical protein
MDTLSSAKLEEFFNEMNDRHKAKNDLFALAAYRVLTL